VGKDKAGAPWIQHAFHQTMKLEAYLESTDVIDWKTPAVRDLAGILAPSSANAVDLAGTCFEWVRDRIGHSGDIGANVVTCSASDVLREGTGWCFAKSHLLAALLRANQIPAGLCYQRLRLDDGTGFTLHGLCAVHLPLLGWYRIDARGNKPGLSARFTPPVEQLAWPIAEPGEADLPEIWPEPLACVVEYLTQSNSLAEAISNLPDIELIGG
jgi:transglutaminase-like putative cysteine protease